MFYPTLIFRLCFLPQICHWGQLIEDERNSLSENAQEKDIDVASVSFLSDGSTPSMRPTAKFVLEYHVLTLKPKLL